MTQNNKLTKIQKIIYFYDKIVDYIPESNLFKHCGNGVEFVKVGFFSQRIKLFLSWKEIDQIQQAHKLRLEML